MPRRRVVANASIAIAYIRVSTDDQALGPQAQRAAIERWAASAGVSVAVWCEDLGISGGAPYEERPALQRAVEALQLHGAGTLVVAKRDRLARDVMTAAIVERMAERLGARVLTADGTGNGEGPEALLMRSIVDAFAQYERALIRARTKAALGVKRARGERVGEIPLGFAAPVEGALLATSAEEQRAIARARELRAAGASIRAIARALTAEGYCPRGERWHPTTVARLLARAA
jgi:DNA invertase Pin-like site-specific DNA recombinase